MGVHCLSSYRRSRPIEADCIQEKTFTIQKKKKKKNNANYWASAISFPLFLSLKHLVYRCLLNLCIAIWGFIHTIPSIPDLTIIPHLWACRNVLPKSKHLKTLCSLSSTVYSIRNPQHNSKFFEPTISTIRLLIPNYHHTPSLHLHSEPFSHCVPSTFTSSPIPTSNSNPQPSPSPLILSTSLTPHFNAEKRSCQT